MELIAHDEASIRRLVSRLGDPRRLRACYQAGPTGYELAQLLASMHVRCEVIAHSLIPKAPGDKARDRPPRRPPAGAAAPRRGAGGDPHIPTVREEAVRDLCRARVDWSRIGPAPAIG